MYMDLTYWEIFSILESFPACISWYWNTRPNKENSQKTNKKNKQSKNKQKKKTINQKILKNIPQTPK